jgi:hypothetical protein
MEILGWRRVETDQEQLGEGTKRLAIRARQPRN